MVIACSGLGLMGSGIGFHHCRGVWFTISDIF